VTVENAVNVPDNNPVINVQVQPTPVTIENKNAIYVPENVPDVIIEPQKPRNVKVTRNASGKISGMKEEK
jgi:TATA-box binding protein (TBP) (component of TFIID and TFIIIB)